MWTKIKHWLFDRFLPEWCRQELIAENAAMRARVDAVKRENAELRAYIQGMESAIKRSRVIIKMDKGQGVGRE